VVAGASPPRRLVAIVCLDIAGYSRLIGIDEEGTLERVKAVQHEVIAAGTARHRGRVVKMMGDGTLIEFASVVDAVRYAADVQAEMRDRNRDVPDDRRLELRIGINVGDVLEDGDDILGDGVNVAARLEALARPGAVAVSDAAYQQVRDKVELAFEDTGEHALKNIARPVRVWQTVLDLGSPAPPVEPLPLPRKPSIAVLPFTNISDDAQQEYFSDGITADLITALSRVRWLFVIARNSSFAYRDRADVADVANELGVRYVLQGSVRKAGGRLRISGQLIDAATRRHVWADRFDGELTDVFELQDRVTACIVGAIEPSLLGAEIERARVKPAANLDAYDHVLRAYPAVWSQTRAGNDVAHGLLTRAVLLDPGYALARALLSWTHAQRVVYGWADEIEGEIGAARAHARAALDAAGGADDPLVLIVYAATLTLVGGDLDAADQALRTALEIDPNSAFGWNRLGWVAVFQGEGDTALSNFEQSTRLSPRDPMRFNTLIGRGFAHFIAGRFDEAVESVRRGLRERPDAVWAYRVLMAACAAAGRQEEAGEALAALLQAYPGMTVAKTVAVLPMRAEVLERYAAALRLAGLPD
jgi:adenylate cyclase